MIILQIIACVLGCLWLILLLTVSATSWSQNHPLYLRCRVTRSKLIIWLAIRQVKFSRDKRTIWELVNNSRLTGSHIRKLYSYSFSRPGFISEESSLRLVKHSETPPDVLESIGEHATAEDVREALLRNGKVSSELKTFWGLRWGE